MTRARKIPVSQRALVQRINRKLRADTEQLRAARGDRGRDEFGDYFVVDCFHNRILATHVDPEAYGRELGVLRPWETLAAEGARP